jgi:hypothetical protein
VRLCQLGTEATSGPVVSAPVGRKYEVVGEMRIDIELEENLPQ